MKTDSMNHNNIAFGVSQKDIPAVKKACESIAKRITEDACRIESVNLQDIKEKVYLSACPAYSKGKDKATVLKVDMTDKRGINAYTYIPTSSVKQCKEYLNSQKAVREISDIVDDLKKRLDKAAYRESYTD